MNKKIFFSLILGVLVLGIVSASVTGFAVSVKEDSAKSFSYQDRDYSVELQKQDDGSIDVEINGEKFEGVKEGDVVSVNGAEVEVKDLGKTWFLGKTQAQLEVKEKTEAEYEYEYEYEGDEDSTDTNMPLPEEYATYQGVLNMLNNWCHVDSVIAGVSTYGDYTGNDQCGENYTCVGTFFSDKFDFMNNSDNFLNTGRVKCSDIYEGSEEIFYMQSICCQVPLN